MPLQNNKQSGLALIMVLFIFALVSLMAISMQSRQAMDIAQASTTFSQTQAMQMIISAEEIAKAGLKFDMERDSSSSQEWDTASELWNQYFATKLGQATVEMNIRDLQGLFNLNSLQPTAPDSTQAMGRFQRLMNNIDPSFSDASSVAVNLKEWFIPGSSQNFLYQNKIPAYRAGEQAMVHPSELKLVEGMTTEFYEKIEPYITALPNSVQLNINTTDPHILASWDNRLNLSDAQAITAKTHSGNCGKGRETYVIQKISDFMSEPAIDNIVKTATSEKPATFVDSDFTVKSEYFSVLIRVTMDMDSDGSNDVDITSESIIKRTGGKGGFIGVIYRDLSRTTEEFSGLKIVNC